MSRFLVILALVDSLQIVAPVVVAPDAETAATIAQKYYANRGADVLETALVFDREELLSLHDNLDHEPVIDASAIADNGD